MGELRKNELTLGGKSGSLEEYIWGSKAQGLMGLVGFVLRWAGIFIIGVYRAIAPGHLSGGCRMYPSCSTYALEALKTLSFGRALGLIAKRVLCCHPWNRTVVDCVPSHDQCEGRRKNGR